MGEEIIEGGGHRLSKVLSWMRKEASQKVFRRIKVSEVIDGGFKCIPLVVVMLNC